MQASVIEGSAKCQTLLRLVTSLSETPGARTVIVSQYDSLLDVFSHLLSHFPYSRICGDASPEAAKSQAAVFARGDSTVLLLHSSVPARVPSLDLSASSSCIFHDVSLDLPVRLLLLLESSVFCGLRACIVYALVGMPATAHAVFSVLCGHSCCTCLHTVF